MSRWPEGLLGDEFARLVGLDRALGRHDRVHLGESGLSRTRTVVADLSDQSVRRQFLGERPRPDSARAPAVVDLEHVEQLVLELPVVGPASHDHPVYTLESVIERGEVGVLLGDRREHGSRRRRATVVATLDGLDHHFLELFRLSAGDVRGFANLRDAVGKRVLVREVLGVEPRLVASGAVRDRVIDQEQAESGSNDEEASDDGPRLAADLG